MTALSEVLVPAARRPSRPALHRRTIARTSSARRGSRHPFACHAYTLPPLEIPRESRRRQGSPLLTVTSGRYEGVDKTTGLRSEQYPDGTFNAELGGKGKTFSFTFTKPGSYTYYCDIHQGMNATIVVVADPTSTEGVQK